MLVFCIEAILGGAVDVDYGYYLCITLNIISPPIKMTIREEPLTFPACTIGTTISLWLSPSHAICPGNSSTSGTSTVLPSAAAVPHTPLPKAIVWQATFPWNGPRIREGLLADGSRT